jgi:phosphoglycerol geranylgeranyltransferase
VKLGKTESALIREIKSTGTICFALIDPEDFKPRQAARLARKAQDSGASGILIGGSTVLDQGQLDDVVMQVKRSVTIPVILFPGNITGVSRHADAILFSSLLNSSNPYFIVGAQTLGAMQVHRYKLEAIPMAYLIFGAGGAAGFVGQVNGIPMNKPRLAVMYSLAAQYLGMRVLYLEAGSGADLPVQPDTVQTVRSHYKGVLIVGGGIRNAELARGLAKAGADILVTGNLLRTAEGTRTLKEIVKSIKSA